MPAVPNAPRAVRLLVTAAIVAAVALWPAAWAGASPAEYVASEALVVVEPGPTLPTSAWRVLGDQDGAAFGAAVASAGDVNGDGYEDVVVGAPRYNNGLPDAGRVFLFLGGPDGLSDTPAWIADGPEAGAFLGASVAGAGDVNGDGYDDLLVGVPGLGGGLAYVYYGGPAGPSATPDWAAGPGAEIASFGAVVAAAGDVNGDGYADVAIGAPGYADDDAPMGAADAYGRVFVFHGGPYGLEPTPAWTAAHGGWQSRFGAALAGLGDANRDGYDDLAVGAPWASVAPNWYEEGLVAVYYGSAQGLSRDAVWSAHGEPGSMFGQRLAAAGDVNGDGHADLLVVAPQYTPYKTPGEERPGALFLYYGSATTPYAAADWFLLGASDRAHYKTTAAGAGDLDGDGYDDILVAYNGGLQLYLGGPGGPSAKPARYLPVDRGGEWSAGTLASADVNGDGVPDVLVGTWWSADEAGSVNGALGLFDGRAMLADGLTPGEGQGGEGAFQVLLPLVMGEG